MEQVITNSADIGAPEIALALFMIVLFATVVHLLRKGEG
jgi:cbb3-type cytochrome oxidase subunit 3